MFIIFLGLLVSKFQNKDDSNNPHVHTFSKYS